MYEVSEAAIPIGAGGFGAVYQIPTAPTIAFKVVKNPSNEHAKFLENEFDMMRVVYDYRSQKPQLFEIPLPLGFRTTIEAGKEMLESSLQALFKELSPSNATYAMQKIESLPPEICSTLLQQVAPQHADAELALCRLYFGKDAPIQRSRFFNSRNFPIDISTYQHLRSSAKTASCLPPPAQVVAEMGRMLASIHSAGFDARDVEFVLGGSTTSSTHESLCHAGNEALAPTKIDSQPAPTTPHPWGFYTFDFNQMRPLTGNVSVDVQLLYDSYFLNDPYFPRPRVGADLYDSFKDGYCSFSAVPKATVAGFFAQIEQEQSRRDAK